MMVNAVVTLGISLVGGIIGLFMIPERCLVYCESTAKMTRKYMDVILFGFLVLTFLALYAINQFVLLRFMNSGDEHSCYFLAECFRNGKYWVTPHPLAEFFDVTHIGNKDGKWFSVYPPGWPILMALALQLNITDLMNPLMAVIAVFFWFQVGKKIFGLTATTLGILLMCISPFFLFNNASYFSHTTCFLMLAVFFYTYLKWLENRRVYWAILCAFAIGYGLGTRYLTTAAIVAPFLLYELIALFLKRDRWTPSHMWFGIVLGIMVYLNLNYNYFITGSFFEAPNHYHHRWERLGFHKNHTLWAALRFAFARIPFLMEWIPSAIVILYFVSLLGSEWSNVRRTLWCSGLFFLVTGYLFYYSWGGNQYGPRYYFEGLPFITLSASAAVRNWWRHGSSSFKKFLLAVLVTSIGVNIYLFMKQAQLYRLISSERRALYDVVEQTAKRPSIVFIHGFLGDTLVLAEEDAVRNNPKLDTEILYAHDLGAKNQALKKFYPNQTYYLGYYDRNAKKARLDVLLDLNGQT